MQRELSTFPIAPSLKSKLCQNGFLIVEDIHKIKPSELSKETGLSLQESLEIIKTVFNKEDGEASNTSRKISLPKSLSALQILQQEQNQPSIISFSQQIDTMIGGGIPLGKMTEFCGAPGIGKTQMCMQLCVDVGLPECLGGVQGEAVYIDTEGSFIVERLVDITKATIEHCQVMMAETSGEVVEELKDFTLENILQGIHYFRCHDYIELLANIQLLPNFLKKHPNVKLIVLDSIAFHFRHDFDDLSLRTRLLTSMAQNLIKLATQHQLAVVLTNQMTTKIKGGLGTSSLSHLVPALGESWGHASTIRIILHWVGNIRHALLYKSPSKREQDVPYQITVGGIRDIIEDNSFVDEPSEDNSFVDEPSEELPAKRQKLAS